MIRLLQSRVSLGLLAVALLIYAVWLCRLDVEWWWTRRMWAQALLLHLGPFICLMAGTWSMRRYGYRLHRRRPASQAAREPDAFGADGAA